MSPWKHISRNCSPKPEPKHLQLFTFSASALRTSEGTKETVIADLIILYNSSHEEFRKHWLESGSHRLYNFFQGRNRPPAASHSVTYKYKLCQEETEKESENCNFYLFVLPLFLTDNSCSLSVFSLSHMHTQTFMNYML